MTNTTQYLVRWLCHDLATPIASVMTASELLGDTPDAEINDLVQSGARRLSARLRLVRLALGAAETPMASATLAKLIGEGLDGTAIDWAWAGDAIDGMASLIACAALLTADLNRTKALAITQSAVLVPAGCKWPDSVAAVLSGAAPSCNRGALAAMAITAASAAGKALSLQTNGLHW